MRLDELITNTGFNSIDNAIERVVRSKHYKNGVKYYLRLLNSKSPEETKYPGQRYEIMRQTSKETGLDLRILIAQLEKSHPEEQSVYEEIE